MNKEILDMILQKKEEADEALKKERNMNVEKMFTIKVYIDDGRIFEYDVASEASVREHASAIAKDGYRHNDGKIFEHYPSHRILKIKCEGDIYTKYPDRSSGTYL